jgi:Secretion system C-terminal sorting domain
MKKIYLFITLLSTSCFFGQTNYLVENFNYPAAAALNANGWYTHSGVSGTTGLPTNPIAVSSSGLTWATYVGSNIGNAALVTNTGEDVNKPFAGDINDGAVYASFLFKPSAAITSTATGNYFFHFGKYDVATPPAGPYSAVNSSFRGRVFIIQGTNTATQFKLGLNFNDGAYTTTNNITAANFDISKTYLLVAKYTFVPGADNDTVSLYVFAEGDDISVEPATPTLVAAATLTGSPAALAPDLNVIQNVCLRQASAGQNATVDGIYVRKVWDLTNPGVALGVDKFEKNTLKVYPNPAQNNRVSIYSSIEGEKEITLTDMSGKVVLKKTMTSEELDLTTVNKGVYLLQTKVGASTSTTKLIVN